MEAFYSYKKCRFWSSIHNYVSTNMKQVSMIWTIWQIFQLFFLFYYTLYTIIFVYSLERKLYIVDNFKSQSDWIKGYVKSW